MSTSQGQFQGSGRAATGIAGVVQYLYERQQAQARSATDAAEASAFATAGTQLSDDALIALRYLMSDLTVQPEVTALGEVLRSPLFRPDTKAMLVSAIHDAKAVSQNGLLALTDWGPGEPQFATPGRVDDSKRKLNRILLAIHGTFSSSANLLGYFRSELQQAIDRTYSAVLAFDHYTLTLNPRQNAEDLALELAKYLDDNNLSSHKIDIICHSRGGLVARSLVEKVSERHQCSFQFDRVHFVATPNGGTHLASPLYVGNVLQAEHDLAALGGYLLGAPDLALTLNHIQTKEEVASVLRLIPGLESMNPHGTFVAALNSDAPASFPQYSAACADHEPDGEDHPDPFYMPLVRRFAPTRAKALCEAFVAMHHPEGWKDYEIDRIFAGRANDTVVDTDTVAHIHPLRTERVLAAKDVLCFANPKRFSLWKEADWTGVELLAGVNQEEDGGVEHSTFFSHPRWTDFVIKQLAMR